MINVLFPCQSTIYKKKPNIFTLFVYSSNLSPHRSGNRGPTNFCLCYIMASVFPLCIVSLFSAHQVQISSNIWLYFKVTSSTLSPMTYAMVSSAKRCTSPSESQPGRLFTWCFKPPYTSLIMSYHALAPRLYKRLVVSGFVYRIYRRCM